jgi:hypothetical protein
MQNTKSRVPFGIEFLVDTPVELLDQYGRLNGAGAGGTGTPQTTYCGTGGGDLNLNDGSDGTQDHLTPQCPA